MAVTGTGCFSMPWYHTSVRKLNKCWHRDYKDRPLHSAWFASAAAFDTIGKANLVYMIHMTHLASAIWVGPGFCALIEGIQVGWSQMSIRVSTDQYIHEQRKTGLISVTVDDCWISLVHKRAITGFFSEKESVYWRLTSPRGARNVKIERYRERSSRAPQAKHLGLGTKIGFKWVS